MAPEYKDNISLTSEFATLKGSQEAINQNTIKQIESLFERTEKILDSINKTNLNIVEIKGEVGKEISILKSGLEKEISGFRVDFNSAISKIDKKSEINKIKLGAIVGTISIAFTQVLSLLMKKVF